MEQSSSIHESNSNNVNDIDGGQLSNQIPSAKITGYSRL